jgi:hypothetical protein
MAISTSAAGCGIPADEGCEELNTCADAAAVGIEDAAPDVSTSPEAGTDGPTMEDVASTPPPDEASSCGGHGALCCIGSTCTGSLACMSGTCCSAGESVCGGACVDEQSDTSNCGGCGLACASACKGAECITTLLGGQSPVGAIATDGNAVYWTGFGQSVVLAVSTAGGSATTLASGQNLPCSVTALGGAAYWTNYAGSTSFLVKRPLDGGAAVTLASESEGEACDVAVTGTYAYWTEEASGAVVRVPLDGGAAVPIFADAGDSPVGITTDGANVYWVDEWDSTNVTGDVIQAPLDGGPLLSLTSGQGRPRNVAVSGENVYFVNEYGIVRVPTGGGTATTLVSAPLFAITQLSARRRRALLQ